MKYFLTDEERKATGSTCFHEFCNGAQDSDNFIFREGEGLHIHDELMFATGLRKIIRRVVKDYDRYGITVVSREQWLEILSDAIGEGGECKEAIMQLLPWANENFEKYDYFSTRTPITLLKKPKS